MRRTLLIACILIPGVARADWQYTHWGQPLADVLASPGVAIRKTTTQESFRSLLEDDVASLPKLIAPYRASDIDATAYFYFEDDRLDGVRLSFPDETASGLALGVVSAQYGKPASQDAKRNKDDCLVVHQHWRDEKRGNLIDLRVFDCPGKEKRASIFYSPIPTEKSGF